MFGLGPPELIIVGVIAVLLFGKRLPEIARSAGKSMTEFKRGMTGVENELHSANLDSPQSTYHDNVDDHQEATAPKFEPPTSEPKSEEKVSEA